MPPAMKAFLTINQFMEVNQQQQQGLQPAPDGYNRDDFTNTVLC
jgi:hypothetical protein